MTATAPENQHHPIENRLDKAVPGNDTTLPGVNRIDLMKDHKPADACPVSSLPGLTIVGCDKAAPSPSGDSAAARTATPAAAPDSRQQNIDGAKKALESPDASIKQKMEAISSLYDNLPKNKDGSVNVKLNDGGKDRDFQVSKQSVGHGVNLLQLNSQDANGKAHPVLRGVERRGEIEQQRYDHGGKSNYQGDWWAAHSADSSVSKFKNTQAETTPHKVDTAPSKVDTTPNRTETTPQRTDTAPHKVDATPQKLPHKTQDTPPPVEHKQPEHKTHKPNDATVTPPAAGADRIPDTRTDKPSVNADGRAIVSDSQRSKFYTRQDDGHSCAGMSVAMLDAHQRLGRPVQHGPEAQRYKALTGTLDHGYRGSLDTMAGQIKSIGLHAKAYDYGMGKVGPQAINDLNRELDQGHSAVAKVINPHTGNPHYIFIAGRDASGKYILGDPDRKNTAHFQPVSAGHLLGMMSRRDGFVAGWR